ncbi:hypothetical protein BV22DRAFT_1199517 [Leucogyrophana mollusca]|uniref:Uncharacterized protein n=1 Tax=Leucogyrophana mollusca TaxID=85980 RepID=A0ACB8B0N0_9AGAM|nr:hypothetical protein BV22DRAFT_1199517 [Leucogyrophana mollusca]
MKKAFFAAILLCASWSQAQTQTVVDPVAGDTVVEVVTSNLLGIATTEILQTLIGSTSSLALTTSTPLTSTSALLATSSASTLQQGPVGQPAPEVPAGGPTPYTYTTVNADGETVVLQGIFTPTGPVTALPNPTTTGVVLNYSSWLKMVGTNTVPASAATRVSFRLSGGWYGIALSSMVGIVGGTWLVLF